MDSPWAVLYPCRYAASPMFQRKLYTKKNYFLHYLNFFVEQRLPCDRVEQSDKKRDQEDILYESRRRLKGFGRLWTIRPNK